MSFNEIRRALCESFTAAFPDSRGDVVDVYDDHCIISDDTGQLYEVPYTIDESGKVTTGDMSKVRKQVDYVAIQSAGRFFAAVGAPTAQDYGWKWIVQIIDAGADKQGHAEYPLAVLHAAAPIYEGARVFALTQGQHDDPANPYGKSVRDLAGWISDVKPNATGLEGTFNILKSSQWLRDMIADAWDRGKKDIVGLSHDVMARTSVAGASGPKKVEEIVKVDSVDVVYDPIAGGKILRMAAAAKAGQKEAEMLNKLLAALKAQRPDLYATIEAKVTDKTVTEDEVTTLLASAITPETASSALVTQVKAAMQDIVAAMKGNGTEEELKKALDETRLIASRLALKEALKDSYLPDISIARISRALNDKVCTAEQIQAAIKEEKEYIDKITGSGSVEGGGMVRIGSEEPEKIQAAMDMLFGVEVDERLRNVTPMRSLRAAYEQITGDHDVTGRVSREGQKIGEQLMSMMRLPAAYSSSSFTYVLGNTLYRRMVQDYKAIDFKEDVLISYERNARDFRTMESVLVGYFGDLPDVDPETADYVEITMPTDAEISYAVNQKGVILTVTRKVVMNDDIKSVQTLVSRLTRSARRTKAQRVWNKIINNATWDGDSKAIFHSDHANLGAVTLTNDATGVTTLYNRLTAMFNQTEQDSSKKLALRPLYEWIPIELESIAYGLNSPWPGVAGGNPHAGRFGANHERIITLPLTTDTNDWGLIADKNEVEIMEIAYLNGQKEPELFVADNPLVGQMFVADKIQYKMRHEYEVEVIDYRGLDKSVV
jgi:hypothetical protein